MKKCKQLKSKKAQQIFVSMMVSIIALIVLIIIVFPLKTEIQKSTNGTYSTLLNTSNSSMAIEHKATTIILDMTLFYFIAILIGASVAFISGRKTFVQIATAIMTFVIVSVLISPLKTLIILARDSSHLDCAAATFTVGQKLGCIFLGLWLFYFVAVCVFVAASYIFIKTTSKGA